MENHRTYAMLAKPVSGKCNLKCEYCYYLGKEKVLKQQATLMPEEILDLYIKQNIEMHGKEAVIEFAWHGGEPMLAGLDFYEKVIRLQQRYGADRNVHNSIQTNGTLITDEWCEFFKEHKFDIGVSIDGPEKLHNAYRKRNNGEGSFEETMRGIKLLQKHEIPFSALTTVNNINMEHPLHVYRFLRELTDYIQFLPVVERIDKETLAPFSVTPEGYGSFLCTIWDEWMTFDTGKINVQMFDITLGNLQGQASTLCVHNPVCGHSGSIEVNGDVYSCDRFAFPTFKLGNITKEPLYEIMEKNRNFGLHKTYGLANECFDCEYLKLCFGGCPKDRFDDKKNYLCNGYKKFFSHIVKNIK